MRVEQLVGNYTSSQRQAHKRPGTLRFPGKGRTLKGSVLDAVYISADEIEEDFGWFLAYILQLPDDVVIEKIRQVFQSPSATAQTADDLLVEKLLFEIL
jgi:hypothetical protein